MLTAGARTAGGGASERATAAGGGPACRGTADRLAPGTGAADRVAARLGIGCRAALRSGRRLVDRIPEDNGVAAALDLGDGAATPVPPNALPPVPAPPVPAPPVCAVNAPPPVWVPMVPPVAVAPPIALMGCTTGGGVGLADHLGRGPAGDEASGRAADVAPVGVRAAGSRSAATHAADSCAAGAGPGGVDSVNDLTGYGRTRDRGAGVGAATRGSSGGGADVVTPGRDAAEQPAPPTARTRRRAVVADCRAPPCWRSRALVAALVPCTAGGGAGVGRRAADDRAELR